MLTRTLKVLGLLFVLPSFGAVCVSSCETDPLVELNTPTAVVNGGTVTVTVTGQESQPTNQPPYDDYYLYAKLYQTRGSIAIDHPEIGPYGWSTGSWAPCSGGLFVQRRYRDFSITFSGISFQSGDKFKVRVRSNEGEGFDPLEVWSPEITVP